MKSDERITKDVMQSILWDARVSPASIDVSTKEGVVELSGVVDSHIKKWSARETAFNIPDVKDVIDTIVVKSAYKMSDAALQKNLEHVLENDIRLDGSDIQITVENGTVVLSGEVNSLYQKIAAEETCRWVRGVMEAKNELVVEPETERVDEEIAEHIDRLVKSSKVLKGSKIDVSVENRIVKLTGTVERLKERIEAEALASLTPGVTFVKNTIEVVP